MTSVTFCVGAPVLAVGSPCSYPSEPVMAVCSIPHCKPTVRDSWTVKMGMMGLMLDVGLMLEHDSSNQNPSVSSFHSPLHQDWMERPAVLQGMNRKRRRGAQRQEKHQKGNEVIRYCISH